MKPPTLILKHLLFSDKLLDYHVKRIHEASRPNICRICSKGFVKRSDLKQHLRLHLGIKKNVCPECNRPFAHSSNLYRHMKVHSKDAPYQCAVCHKHFLQVSGLNQHSRIHLKEQSDQKRSGKMASSNLAEPVLAQSDTFRKTPEPVDQIRFNNENGILQGVQIQVIEDSVQKEQKDDEEGELIQPAVQVRPENQSHTYIYIMLVSNFVYFDFCYFKGRAERNAGLCGG